MQVWASVDDVACLLLLTTHNTQVGSLGTPNPELPGEFHWQLWCNYLVLTYPGCQASQAVTK